MTRSKVTTTALLLGLVALLSGCSSAPNGAPSTGASTSDASATECAGVDLTVDFANLGPSPIHTCVESDASIAASEVLKRANVSIEGTAQYGTAIVCRVNGAPDQNTSIQTVTGAYTEDCTDMPSANAYWSVWVASDGGWDYASVGFDQLQLVPGQGLGLFFDIDNSVVEPPRS
ncbi:MAG: hypothetical protein ACKOXM_00580 [Agromyces sp.]